MQNHDARDLNLKLNPKLLKPLFTVNPFLHAGAIGFNWLVIFSAAYCCMLYLNPFTYMLAILVIGARMHALAILMHDATHFRFLKNRKWNDLITNVFTMYPLFLTIEKYRANHLAHHQNLNTEHDPDWVSKLPKSEFQFPTTKKDFALGVLAYFLLVQGIKDAIWFVKRFNLFGAAKKKSHEVKLLPMIIFYIVLVTVLTVFSMWSNFLLFWIVPYFSTFLMFQYIRSVSEHFGDLAYDHLLSSSRTVKTNALERFFIAPHNVGYHIEHHLFPGVPFHNLPALHQLLAETDTYQKHAHVTKGYLTGLLKELV